MKFLPYEHLNILSPLNKDEVLKRLSDAIEPKRHLRWLWSSHKPYEGEIEGFNFNVSRIVVYRNSFIPRIKGEIHSEINGCSVRITMQMNVFVTVFWVFWLTCVSLFFFLMLGIFISTFIQSGMQDPTMLFFPLGMFAFGYLLALIGFKFESSKSKKFFQELFEAHEVEELGFRNPFWQAG